MQDNDLAFNPPNVERGDTPGYADPKAKAYRKGMGASPPVPNTFRDPVPAMGNLHKLAGRADAARDRG